MTTIKKTTTKKAPIKKVIEQKDATTEDLVLGNVVEDVLKTEVLYEDASVQYKVTNLINNNVIECDGTLVETYIGSNNIQAREELKNGAKVVITKGYNNKEEYKIEVV